MKEILLSLADILKDKDPFKHLKGPLNILFVCNITYFLYCAFYTSAPNLKNVAQFSWGTYVLHAEYIIPFGLFVLVWALTWFLGRLLFENSNWLITEKARTWILDQSILSAFDTNSNQAQQNEIHALAKAPKGNLVVHLYKAITGSIPKEKIPSLRRAMQLTQDECSADFVLIIRALLLLVIAFAQVDCFGGLLFAALFLFLIGFAITLYFSYQLAAIIPIIGYKLSMEIKEREANEAEN